MILTKLFESIASSKKLYLRSALASNTSWYWIVFESIVSLENCIRCAIDFQIFSRYTTCSRLVRLFVTIERLSRRNKVTFNFERVMILNVKLFESIVSSKRLHLSCYWILDTFSLYDLIWICCTTCSWLDYICNCSSMFMCFSWCKDSKCLFLTKFSLFF